MLYSVSFGKAGSDEIEVNKWYGHKYYVLFVIKLLKTGVIQITYTTYSFCFQKPFLKVNRDVVIFSLVFSNVFSRRAQPAYLRSFVVALKLWGHCRYIKVKS